ncbi:MAG: hypothetical protein RLZZ450_3606 [Pseudomonadota bacterium]
MKRHWAVLTVLSLLMACGGKLCGETSLAELVEYQGDVQRDQARAVAAWSAAAQGDRFFLGDGLRTGKSGTAQLSLGAESVALVEPNTVLRFLDRDPRSGGGNRLSLETGVVRVDSGDLTLDVHTVRALARVPQGASLRVISAGGDTRFDVLVGRVAIDADGSVKELEAGQTLALPRALPSGVANDEIDPALAAAGGDDAAQLPAEPRAGTRPGANGTPELKEPDTADLALPETDAMTLHAASLPVTFRLQRPPCAVPVTSELDGHAVAREGTSDELVLRITTAGAHRLRVRCAKRVVRETIVRVQRDAANLELPKSAQRVDVEADGRRYTVRYTNVMPVVSMRWSDARPSSSYQLVVKRGAREQTYRSAKAVRDLAGAELVEGNYDFWFADASGLKSRVGSLRIEFDNTARSLSLSEPVEGSLSSGEQVLVSGVALLRSQVSANGVPLVLDAKGRFHAQVPLSAEKSVLVRANHPAAGVHYYLRRLR